MELVILAGGLSKRFGRLKQIEQIDENKNFIIDYSIHDAIKAGVRKIIFVVKKEDIHLFKKTISKRIKKFVKIKYAIQKQPLGTAHALMCAQNIITNKFIVINCDDFYGVKPIKKICHYLSHTKNRFAIIGYKLKNVINNNSTVKRGICYKDKNNYLTKINENTVLRENNKFFAVLNGQKEKKLTPNMLTSLNLFGFDQTIFPLLNEKFKQFLDDNKNNFNKQEFQLPTVISKLIEEKKIKVKVLSTNTKWQGLTHQEDITNVKNYVNKLKKLGQYKNNLWE